MTEVQLHTVALPIYVDHNSIKATGAVHCTAAGEVVEWEAICHGQRGARFVWVRHLGFRSVGTGRQIAKRLRPWVVGIHHARLLANHRASSSATLAGALKLAKRLAVAG